MRLECLWQEGALDLRPGKGIIKPSTNAWAALWQYKRQWHMLHFCCCINFTFSGSKLSSLQPTERSKRWIIQVTKFRDASAWFHSQTADWEINKKFFGYSLIPMELGCEENKLLSSAKTVPNTISSQSLFSSCTCALLFSSRAACLWKMTLMVLSECQWEWHGCPCFS